MKRSARSVFFVLVLVTVLLTSCTQPTPTLTAAFTPEPIVDTPTAEATLPPAPTEVILPGVEVIPAGTLRASIPWLPMENTARPTSIYYLFNLSKPPFTNVLVRQAFAAAIDREAIAQIARDGGATDSRPATSFTPPETLGRDLFNVVGVSFKPSDARDLLSQAGYTDLSTFPTITLMTNRGVDELNIKLSEALIRMWEIHLGIKVQLEVVPKAYFDRVKTDPTEIYWSGWSADYNDPDDFLLENFHTGSQYNYNNFSIVEFDNLVDQAADATDPLTRQDLYIQAERILCEQEVALIPLYFTTANIP